MALSVVNSRVRTTAPMVSQPAAPPLRICHVMSADLWAGAEVQLATTAAYLSAQPDVRLSAVLFNDGRLAAELRAIGVAVTVIDETRTSALRILSRLTRLMTFERFDVVHTHRYKDTVLGALAARFAGVPHVVRTVHGLHEPATGWAALKLRVYEALDMLALRRLADVVVAVSSHMAEQLRQSGYRPSMVTSIHNGINPLQPAAPATSARVRRELGISPHALVIGTAGRLVPVKGQADLIRAMARILPTMHAARLLIAGEGPLQDDLVALAARLGITDACVFAGHRADVHDVLAAMDIFVLPSLSEGIPMALLEAMSLGVPVVATRVGGMPEVVQHRATGLLVPPGDDGALADACLELAQRREWATEIGAAGRRVVTEEYTPERSGRPLLDTYRCLSQVRQSDRRPPVTVTRPPANAVPDERERDQSPVERLFGYPGRVIARAIERRRMERIRRDPAELRHALQSAKSILIVCQGNIIRSPFAAGLIQRALGSEASVSVRSAGLTAMSGSASHPNAIVMATDRLLDLSGHVATRLTASAVHDSDVILVMDIPQLVQTAALSPDARRKTFLLSCLAPGAPLEVADPVNGDLSMFRTCFAHISDAVAPIALALSHGTVRR